MDRLKRFVTLALVAVLMLGICLPALSNRAEATSFSGVKGPTLVKSNGTWYYVKDGQVCNITTLVKYNGEWWYVVNGKVASDTTSLVKYNGEWWYVVKGKVASNTTTLVKYNNEWWYVVKGKIAAKTTTLVKYNNEWWYVVKGKIAAKTTGMVKYNNEWWYVVKGKVASKTTTLVKWNGSWYYIVKGKLASESNRLVKYNGSWYYVNSGKVDPDATLIAYHNIRYYLVDHGKVDTTPKNMRGVYRYSYAYFKDSDRLEYNQIENYDWSSGRCNSSSYSGIYYYDAKGRVSNVKYWSGGYIIGEDHYTYYDDGSYDIHHTGKEGTSLLSYNSNDQLVYSETEIEIGATSYLLVSNYAYNEYGDLVTETDELFGSTENAYAVDCDTYEYTYNDRGEPVTCKLYRNDTFMNTTYYTYNSKGQLRQTLTYHEADEVWQVVYYHYDLQDGKIEWVESDVSY